MIIAALGAIAVAAIGSVAALKTSDNNKEAALGAARQNRLATEEAARQGAEAQKEQARQQSIQEQTRSNAMLQQEMAYLKYSDKWTQEDRADDKEYGRHEDIFQDIDAIDHWEPSSSDNYDSFYG